MKQEKEKEEAYRRMAKNHLSDTLVEGDDHTDRKDVNIWDVKRVIAAVYELGIEHGRSQASDTNKD